MTRCDRYSCNSWMLVLLCTLARCGLAATLAEGADNAVAATDKPNIVVLFSDDAGYGDFGFQPECVPEMKKLTPFIDSIASEGARFSNAYMTGSVCSPSRAGLMTGRYQQRFGHDNNLPPGAKTGLPLSEVFLAKRLRSLGYRTGLVGKWHLGYPNAFQPNKRGFDSFHGLLQGSRSYFPYPRPTAHRVIQVNGVATPEEGYVTDRFGDAACEFIRQAKQQPFFLFVSFTAPHSPNQPRAADADRIAHIEPLRRRKHCGLTVALDDNVGKILRCLDKQQLSENTIVVFTNDNGGATHTGANNHPLSGRKGSLREGGIRVPMAIRWPGTIKAGTVIDDPVISLDLAPTFIQAAAGKVMPEMKLDGVNLGPRFRGESSRLAERSLYWRRSGSRGARAVRRGRWKLLDDRKSGTPPQLFDLNVDVGEKNDLAEQHRQRVAMLMEQLDAWESPLAEPLWGPGAAQKR